MRDHIPVVVKFHHATDQFGLRHIASEHEHAEGTAISRLPHARLTGARIAQRRFGQPAGTGCDPVKLRMVPHLDLRVVLGFGGNGGIASEIAFAHKNGDFAGVFRQEHRFLGRRESAADHDDFTSVEEFTITGGAVGHASACILLFAGETDFAWGGSGGDENAEAADISAIGVHDLDITIHVQSCRLGDFEFRPEILRLLAHGRGEFAAIGAFDTRIIDYFGRDGDLSTEIRLFQDQYAVSRTRQI